MLTGFKMNKTVNLGKAFAVSLMVILVLINIFIYLQKLYENQESISRSVVIIENLQAPIESLDDLENGTIWMERASYILEPTLDSEMGGDDLHGNLYAADIIINNGIYMMWYGAQSKTGHDGIHFATSEDGIHWKKYGVVIEPGSNNHVNDPSVVLVDGVFYMYFSVAPVDELDEIWMATSNDGINWAIHGRVLGPDDSGWDSLKVGRPSVLYQDGMFKMWFDGSEKDPENPTMPKPGTGRHVGYATSNDGYNWTKWPGNPVFYNSGAVDVEYFDEKYIVVEEWQQGILWRIGNNETDWESRSRVLFHKTNTTFDMYGQVTPFILLQDGKWIATYTGAATWETWNRNRIAVWYPMKNVSLYSILNDSTAIKIRGWAQTRTSGIWHFPKSEICSRAMLEYYRGSKQVLNFGVVLKSGARDFIFSTREDVIVEC
ncbi:MAG: hypothetical protein ACTSWN_13715 [Promethearchaeota archaeon]